MTPNNAPRRSPVTGNQQSWTEEKERAQLASQTIGEATDEGAVLGFDIQGYPLMPKKTSLDKLVKKFEICFNHGSHATGTESGRQYCVEPL